MFKVFKLHRVPQPTYIYCARQKYRQLPGSNGPWNRSAERGGEGTEAGPGPPSREGKDQLGSSRDEGNIMTDKGKAIRDMMQEVSSQQSEKIANSFIIALHNKLCMTCIFCV